ncbi:endonuclease domain-containing protein [Sphingomonas sp. BT553]|uniref:Endonuclease domain-containing protein n=1 Tax=Sphingomonas mollis TaxID=2795726 RepID=A0ABS0XJY0_9SPHN|nr:endonuclease domain-containing protein [Sphingomonas sp. BT553]
MRSEMTPAEVRLWHHLRAGRFDQLKFRRQTVIGPYIADFTCRAAMLVVEVDGDTHATQTTYDANRTTFLEQQGWRVIRFTNADVIRNLEGVLQQLQSSLSPSPNPIP